MLLILAIFAIFVVPLAFIWVGWGVFFGKKNTAEAQVEALVDEITKPPEGRELIKLMSEGYCIPNKDEEEASRRFGIALGYIMFC